jgi:recombinational DNA repair protein RecT
MAPTHNTAIRRLFKYLPVSIEIARAVEIDGRGEAGKDQGLDAVLTGQWSVVDEDSAPEGEPASDNAAPETATTDAPKTSDNSEWLNAADRAAKGV